MQGFHTAGTGLPGNLRETKTNNVTATLGISSAVTLASEGNPPKWASVLPSLGIGYGDVSTTSELLDINGDGLPDYVSRDSGQGTLTVRMNVGFNPTDKKYEFSDGVTFGGTGMGGLSAGPSMNGSGLPVNFSPNDVNGTVNSTPHALQKQDNAMNNVGAGYSYFGGNRTASVSRTVVDMVDMNGDGLPDIVQRTHRNPTMTIWFNTGDGFAPGVDWDVPDWGFDIGQGATLGLGENDALAFTESLGLSLSAGYSYYFETGLFGCYGIELGAGAGKTTTGSAMRLEDIDGDGAPDMVLKKTGDTNVWVRRNPAGGVEKGSAFFFMNGVNLLTTVTGPLGGRIDLDYRRVGHVTGTVTDIAGNSVQVDMPEHQHVLRFIAVSSGYANQNPVVGALDPATETFVDYFVPGKLVASGRYSRTDREFLGFSNVQITRTTNHPSNATPDREVDLTYDNSSYERRHLLLTELARDPGGFGSHPAVLFRKTVRTYDPRPVTGTPGALFPALTSERTFFYEGLTNSENAFVKATTLTYDYDGQGNRTKFDDLGDDDPAVTSDDLHYAIGYQLLNDPIDTGSGAKLARANDVRVRDAGGNLLRGADGRRCGSRGEMQSQTDLCSAGKDPTTGQPYTIANNSGVTFSFPAYDSFGNLQTVVDPTGLTASYTYDPDAQTHVATVTDSFGYSSTRTYNMNFGRLLDTTDINHQVTHIVYDVYGRIKTVCAPADVVMVTGPNGQPRRPAATSQLFRSTIKREAHLATRRSGRAPGIRTLPDRARLGRHLTFDTVVFVDGLGRARQTKKDAVVNATVGRIVSGVQVYDELGRVFQEGFPTFETDANSQQTTKTNRCRWGSPQIATPTTSSTECGRRRRPIPRGRPPIRKGTRPSRR